MREAHDSGIPHCPLERSVRAYRHRVALGAGSLAAWRRHAQDRGPGRGLAHLAVRPADRPISGLTVAQVETNNGDVLLRLGAEPVVLPPPLGALVKDLVADRRGQAAIGNEGTSRWLFPGGQPGRPMSPERMGQRLLRLGLHPAEARSAALFQLATDLPAAVLAQMLGVKIGVASSGNRPPAETGPPTPLTTAAGRATTDATRSRSNDIVPRAGSYPPFPPDPPSTATTPAVLISDYAIERDTGSRPFRVGVVLDEGERALVETPLCFSADVGTATAQATTASPLRLRQPRPWLVTNHRIVARLGDDRLHGWRWEHMVGCRVDLTSGREVVALDPGCQSPLSWTGPGVAPLAVAAVYRLHGLLAVIEHPELAEIRLLAAS
jgi:hypothetical protein